MTICNGFAAALLLLIVSVLPAAAFFRVGHGLQIESFIKFGQLQVALNRIEWAKRIDDIRATQLSDAAFKRLASLRDTNPGAKEWGVYEGFFFDTRPLAATGELAACLESQKADTGDKEPIESGNDATIAETIEELLPFYSESSVNLREMVHNQASDGRWQWRPGADGLVFCSPSKVSAGLHSIVPPFFDASRTSLWRQTPFALLLLGLIAVLATVTWVVRFITTKIFLADVIEPLSSKRSADLREIRAPNLFLVGDAPPASEIPELAFCTIDLSDAPRDETERNQWFGAQLTRVEQSAVRQNVLMLHYERKDDAGFAEQKLALLERIINTLNRTLVVVSAVPPSVAGAAASADRQDTAQADLTHRWDAVLSRFTVVPVIPVAPAPAMPSPASVFGGWSSAGWRKSCGASARSVSRTARSFSNRSSRIHASIDCGGRCCPTRGIPSGRRSTWVSCWWRSASAPKTITVRSGPPARAKKSSCSGSSPKKDSSTTKRRLRSAGSWRGDSSAASRISC